MCHALAGRQAALAALLFCLVPAMGALGFSFGPFSGLSASPDSIASSGSGGNCTLCHDFNRGSGSVAVLGVPAVYQPDAMYAIIVRIADPAQVSAGFQVSVENGTLFKPAHQGTLGSVDTFTQFASGNPAYITHTSAGVQNATANWAANGNAALYAFQWQAPSADVGVIRFFAVGNAVNRDGSTSSDNMYLSTKTTRPRPSGPGDSDQDGDVDAADFEAFAACFSGPGTTASSGCEFFDADSDTDIDLADAAHLQVLGTGTIPQEFQHADGTRGGKLYDRWWAANGASVPAGNHPLYPPAGSQSGPDTFRCQECHGWDYQGAAGQYAGGPHFTGIPGIFGAALRPQQVFDTLKFDANVTTNGHDMAALGFSDEDLWDVTRFVLTELVDTAEYIDTNGVFAGNWDEGLNMFEFHCAGCHWSDGTAINFGTAQDPVYVGTIASQDPWRFLHKIRFGHPGAPMLSLVDLFTPEQSVKDLAHYAQTLPTQ